MISTVAPISENVEDYNMEIPNSGGDKQMTDVQCKNKRIPKRILHFSDGTLEEFSSDDDEIEPPCTKRITRSVNALNPATLAWVPWMLYQTSFVGNRALAACDFLGEYLANFFGIISPKYEYEIEHYKRMIEEEKERKIQDVELGGWSQPSGDVILSEKRENTENC